MAGGSLMGIRTGDLSADNASKRFAPSPAQRECDGFRKRRVAARAQCEPSRRGSVEPRMTRMGTDSKSRYPTMELLPLSVPVRAIRGFRF